MRGVHLDRENREGENESVASLSHQSTTTQYILRRPPSAVRRPHLPANFPPSPHTAPVPSPPLISSLLSSRSCSWPCRRAAISGSSSEGSSKN
ncbi:hypothetical protein GUJ93_ZPchr0004g38849 [Zizania palustris]|uniref:Uncharacterized protein n=1 Tax=Zizania palustris TaxID=103762 RepID=A0A8J5S594_ZIZPA|nr:hypothetical protein GUJ93_ZPchr0004g38849 [Zizania palustris]